MSSVNSQNPLIVQGDHTILMEVDSPRYPEARDRLAGFAELVKSPEHVHTYRMTPLSIWNACAAKMDTEEMVETLLEFSKYPVPEHVLFELRDYASRFGRIKIEREGSALHLTTDVPVLAVEISSHQQVALWLGEQISDTSFAIDPEARGRIKQALIKIGYPAEDIAGYTDGEHLPMELRTATQSGQPFALRPYQHAAAEAFYVGGRVQGGSGVVVLPCGAGKTIVGMGCMSAVQASTLILATNTTSVLQWITEILDKTSLTEEQVGAYTGQSKVIRPVTVATYQILTWRKNKDAPFEHLNLFDRRDWGLIIYDEVHLLPAPVFQVTAGLQARRRLGLTATLVREDGKEDDVFALIGPKKADVPWKELEHQGWIAKATCTEIRIPLPPDLRMIYATAMARQKFRIASENPAKTAVVRELLTAFKGERILIMAMYVDQIKEIADELGIPVLTGATGQKKRDAIFAAFRSGEVSVLAVSKIANFSIDLPDANVAIQISGTFGSRQEEAQRLGRILRPKSGDNQAHFFSLVSRDTREQEFAMKRQLFLCEQGYAYTIDSRDHETT